MQAASITGVALSAATSVDAGYISKLRSGERKMPNAEIVEHFADVLKVRGAWLALGTEPRSEVAEPSPRAPALAESRLRAATTTLTRDDLSPNAHEAMSAFDWSGVSAADYDRVHAALAGEHPADGRDRVTSWWTSQIRRVLDEGRPVAKSVHRRAPATVPTDEGPSPERAAQLAAREAKKGGKKSR